FFIAILLSTGVVYISPSALAQYIYILQDEKGDKKERKQQHREQADAEKTKEKAKPQNAESSDTKSSSLKISNGDEASFTSDKQTKEGDTLICEGYVVGITGDYKLQADHVVFNQVTKDAVAEGNVIFDQGEDQRVTAKRAELNLASKRGTFWDTTG